MSVKVCNHISHTTQTSEVPCEVQLPSSYTLAWLENNFLSQPGSSHINNEITTFLNRKLTISVFKSRF